MNRAGSLLLILLAAVTLGEAALAQSLRMRTQAPVTVKEDASPWDANVAYVIATDYADTVQPRGYTNSVMGDLSYKLNSAWSLSTEIGARAEFFDGQVDKGTQQGYDEVVSPT